MDYVLPPISMPKLFCLLFLLVIPGFVLAQSSEQLDLYTGERLFFRPDYKDHKNALVAEICARGNFSSEVEVSYNMEIASTSGNFRHSGTGRITAPLPGHCQEVIMSFTDKIKGENPYDFTFTIDPEDQVTERFERENNKQQSTRNTIKPIGYNSLPDLGVGQDIEFLPEYRDQENVLIGEVCNGQRASVAADNVITLKAVILKRDFLLQKSNAIKLESSLGERQCIEIPIALGEDLRSYGPHTVLMVADPTNRIMERSEYNNATHRMGIDFIAPPKEEALEEPGKFALEVPEDDGKLYGYTAGPKKISDHLRNKSLTKTKLPYDAFRVRQKEQCDQDIRNDVQTVFQMTENHPARDYLRQKYLSALKKRYSSRPECRG